MDNIVIFGASGHAKVVVDIIKLQNNYKIAGIISPTKEELDGIKYLGSDDEISVLVKKHSVIGGVIAIGDGAIRKKISEKIAKLCTEFVFISAIHPSAIISRTSSIGAGSTVMGGVVINPYTTIGKQCIINTNSTIEHDNSIGDFVNILPSVTTGGNVKIRDFATIGMGTNILPNITIGSNSVVGAGALVCDNIPENIVSYGIPARIIRKNN